MRRVTGHRSSTGEAPSPRAHAPRRPRQDAASIDLLTTSFLERGKGHGTALLRAAEQFLSGRARVRRLVAVASADEREAAALMTRKFGFGRLNGRQTRQLTSDFPALQVRRGGWLGGWVGGYFVAGGGRPPYLAGGAWAAARSASLRLSAPLLGRTPGGPGPPALCLPRLPPQFYERSILLSKDLSSAARAAALQAATKRGRPRKGAAADDAGGGAAAVAEATAAGEPPAA